MRYGERIITDRRRLKKWWRVISGAVAFAASAGWRWMSDDCACDEAAGKTIVIIHVIGQIRETCDLYVELSFTILGTFVAFSMLFFPRNGWGLCPNLQFLVGEAVLALMDGGKAERGNQRTWRHPHPSVLTISCFFCP